MNVIGLLQFMVGATHTTKGPEVAAAGMLMVIEVAFQETTVVATSFRKTALLLCGPKPEPEMTTCVPLPPDVGEMLVIEGAGAATELTETLSKEAVATAELLLALQANPM